MPRYHFNVQDGVSLPDLNGRELPNLHSARLEAAHFIAKVLNDHPDTFWIQHEWRIDVTDATGLILFAINVSAVNAPSLAGWVPNKH